MAYTTAALVLSRGGKATTGIDGTSTPTLTTVEGWVDECAAVIDGYLARHGYTTPATGAAADALAGLNADGVLVLILDARYQAARDTSPNAPPSMADRVALRWEQGLNALRDGTHPAVGHLSAAASQADGQLASSFWTDEGGPAYIPDPLQPGTDHNANTAPDVYKGMPL